MIGASRRWQTLQVGKYLMPEHGPMIVSVAVRAATVSSGSVLEATITSSGPFETFEDPVPLSI